MESFLTAYDPSDLPGGSVDPLGFDRGYLLLADKFLPGLTNVANRPRYFSVLCAAISLYDDGAANDSPRAQHDGRLEAILRAERFWALACLLASQKDNELDPAGLRGIRYVQRAATRLVEQEADTTLADFRLLSRQMPYGLVGIYGSVADELKFIERRSLALGTGIGQRLGRAFIDGTQMPGPIRAAIAKQGSVRISTLTEWGRRAHLNKPPERLETEALTEALLANPVRARATALLKAHPAVDGQHETRRLASLFKATHGDQENVDLREALCAIVAFEKCYRLVLMVFQRILAHCQGEAPFAVELAATEKDPVFASALVSLPKAVMALERAITEARTPAFCAGIGRLQDVRLFLGAVSAAQDVPVLLEAVVERHRRVQQAKRDGGRAKAAWLEIKDRRIVPTLSVAMQVMRAPEKPEDVMAHPYRTSAVDNFLALTGGQ